MVNSEKLIESSFDPSAPIAASALVGPAYPAQPRFSDTLRSRWNLAVSNAVEGVRTTDWASAGTVLVKEGVDLAQRLGNKIGEAGSASGSGSESASKLQDSADGALKSVQRGAESAKEELEKRLASAKQEASSAVAGRGYTLRGESFTGGSEAQVKGQRAAEEAKGRLV